MDGWRDLKERHKKWHFFNLLFLCLPVWISMKGNLVARNVWNTQEKVIQSLLFINMWKFNVSKYEIKKGKKTTLKTTSQRTGTFQFESGPSGYAPHVLPFFGGSHRQGVFGHRGFNIASQRLLWILESQSVAGILLQQMSCIWWPYDDHIMTPFRIIHLCCFNLLAFPFQILSVYSCNFNLRSSILNHLSCSRIAALIFSPFLDLPWFTNSFNKIHDFHQHLP